MKRIVLCLALCCALCAAACGPKNRASFAIEDAFIRATPMKVTAGYLLITNNSGQDDALVGVTANWAGRTELHNVTADKDGVMTMAPVDSIPLPAGKTVGLRPGAYHIMLFDLKKELKVGDIRKATLEFAQGKPMKIRFKVKPITYKGLGSDTDILEDHHH